MGQIIGRQAMCLAIEKAITNGIGMVAVKNSNHFGTAAEYSMMASEKGLIGIAISNTVPVMAPTGGLGKVIGNNPLSFSFPAAGEGPDITIDMAMTTVAYGKLLIKRNNHQPIPYGWGTDKTGKDTTDPNDVINGGYLLPMGGPKGYGLALANEILTSVISGGVVCTGAQSIFNMSAPLNISHTFIAIDYRQVCPQERYQSQIKSVCDDLHSCTRIDDAGQIYIPGEIEAECYENRQIHGVCVSENLVEELRLLAEEHGVFELCAKV
jgi:LDH2 family malate/lactate/ureidoglycolate dehydrogenase